MSRKNPAHRSDDSSDDDPYASFETESGAVVIYEKADPDCWIESETAVEVADMR